MSTATVDIRAALITKLLTLSGIDTSQVAYENKKFAPTTGTPWIRPVVIFSDPRQAEIGEGGRNYLPGVFHVSLFYPVGSGSGAANTRADALITLFARGTVLTYNGQTVTVARAGRSAETQEDKWLHTVVTVYFYAYVAN